jgi:hypothetical protein
MATSKPYRQGIFSEEVVKLFGLDYPGFQPLWGEKSFPFFNEYQGTFPEVKQPGREVDHSTPSGAEAKKEWNYTSTPPTYLHGVDMENLLSIIFSFFRFYAII